MFTVHRLGIFHSLLRRELTWSILPDVIWLILDLDTQYFDMARCKTMEGYILYMQLKMHFKVGRDSWFLLIGVFSWPSGWLCNGQDELNDLYTTVFTQILCKKDANNQPHYSDSDMMSSGHVYGRITQTDPISTLYSNSYFMKKESWLSIVACKLPLSTVQIMYGASCYDSQ